MGTAIAAVLIYFAIGIALLARELYLYPAAGEDRRELISAAIVCVVLWPFFVVWCLREWWRERNG